MDAGHHQAHVIGQSGRTIRAANKTNALTARRARPVLAIGMDHASTAVLSAPSAPT
ncbi:amino acid transporter [Xanthomonas oryzae pv. oryzae]|nr:amino acid transporter [Xanthomonas oryzae pv. oryzae]AUI95925.1 amino acid transporter [Xanthomonas oryzae pv. oryzae]AUI99598.1 amino acid transporter [Xanthomonas oryzae pv. oryzae]AUJ03274.1 amino acid transporter [Xanthomonas oryzae pv. oryzae]AUJ06938.1 amino acid transporter [Xanthomonas oryzae pv. oryzae]